MSKSLLKFYSSCFLSSWGDRLWYFALSIYFVTINKDSLLITALNGLLCNLFAILFGPILGGLVDKHQRIKVVRWALFIQNFSVALNCTLFVLIVVFKNFTENTWNGWFLYFAQASMIILNVISRLASTTAKISIERDWVVVISEQLSQNPEEKSQQLSIINSQVRRIDLSTNIIAPLIAGLVMSFFNLGLFYNGTVLSAVIFAAWNVISYAIEIYLLSSVYKQFPALEKTKIERNIEKKRSNLVRKFRKSLRMLKKGWKVYLHQGDILIPSISFALLFLTVLSFDSITIGYSKAQKLKEFTISILHGLGSISGLLGTIAFPFLHNKLKIRLHLVGIIGNIAQIIFLFGCLAAIFLPGSPFIVFHDWSNMCTNETSNHSQTIWTHFVESNCHEYTSILVLLSCMAFSRFGLWLTDLVINQIFQEKIKEEERGVVGGVQSSINMFFDLVKYLAVIALNDVNQYGYLVIMSVSAVSISFCLYIAYSIKIGCKQEPHLNESKIRKSMIKYSKEADKNENVRESDSFYESENETEKLNNS
ncbi:solute carrier family 40 member 1 [Brachionus plicatilis]|uniref:Solute carrier family 40 member n=1 Tax=Brachionus plicatilis TaxID=10195 RepID=A0A3M7S6F6_BRAPC|nr:solute carrier family 40 member 1 [Brachionus plicatilis]